MTKRSGTLSMRLALAGAIAGCATPPAMAQSGEGEPPTAAPARDPDIAVQEEFDAARRADTVKAWELFIARHPDHPLAREAQQQLRRLTGQ
ncbi:hypothetical protein [Rhizobium sp. GN54]|uniref:hypothetical protein n=1 Tax=Rhizobium sp. GN54 TaxID=2898150 RepID=UPI001E637F0D|nr:hypothetical protein [Rhizobium sp. GN54]MCD2183865.1 hypothetical protein [Rhizobium sp. GN54]